MGRLDEHDEYIEAPDDSDTVYELLDDDPALDPVEPPSLRTGLRSLKPTRRTLRWAGAVVLACAVGAGSAAAGTAWHDARDRSGKNAAVVDLALDAVTDGDPAAVSADDDTKTARSQYVLEIANNGPDAVTVTDAAVNLSQAITTAGWHPAGSPSIAPGGVGKVVVDLKLDCVWLMVSRYLAPAGDGGSSIFPPASLTVRTSNGASHQLTLSASPDTGGASFDFNGLGQHPAPTVSMVYASPCSTISTLAPNFTAAPTLGDGLDSQSGSGQSSTTSEPVTLAYHGVTTAATSNSPKFTMAFTAANPSKTSAVTLDTTEGGFSTSSGSIATPFTITYDPSGDIELAPGASASFTITVGLQGCDPLGSQGLLGSQLLGVSESTDSSGLIRPLPLGRLLTTAGLRLAVDETAQVKAACP